MATPHQYPFSARRIHPCLVHSNLSHYLGIRMSTVALNGYQLVLRGIRRPLRCGWSGAVHHSPTGHGLPDTHLVISIRPIRPHQCSIAQYLNGIGWTGGVGCGDDGHSSAAHPYGLARVLSFSFAPRCDIHWVEPGGLGWVCHGRV